MAASLDDCRAAYFTYKGTVEKLIGSATAPDVPDGQTLAKLHEAAGELARFAGLLRHYLPERADEQLEATKRRLSEKGGYYGDQPCRYAVVWPDGEVYGGAPYVQRPAAVRKFEQGSRNLTGLRLWDNRLGKFVLGA